MLYAIVAVLILILDQGLKYYTTMNLAVNTGVKELVPGLLQLRNVHNSGSAFSFLNGWPYARWLFLGVTAVFVILVILALSRRWIKGGFGRWMALFVLAGALGNGIDRLLYGYVVDMLEFAFKLPLVGSFPVFNVADVFITCGAIAFCLYILLHKERPEQARAYGHVRRGPGGSVTTRPAPRPKAKPEPKPAPAPAAKPAEKAAAQAAAPETPVREGGRRAAPRREAGRRESLRDGRRVAAHVGFTEETKRRPGEDPFAEWMGTAEIRTDEKTEEEPKAAAQKPAREVAPEPPSAGKPFTLDIPERRGREDADRKPSGPVTLDIPAPGGASREKSVAAPNSPVTLDIPVPSGAARENPFTAPSGPVTLDIPAPGGAARENPFTAPSGPVTLDIPAPSGASRENPFAPPSGPVTLDIPAPMREEAPKREETPKRAPAAAKPEPKPAPERLDIPAPKSAEAPKPETIRLDTPDDEEFTLEDILNEFRDL